MKRKLNAATIAEIKAQTPEASHVFWDALLYGTEQAGKMIPQWADKAEIEELSPGQWQLWVNGEATDRISLEMIQ